MSEISDASHVDAVLADYVASDATGKLNIIGGNITFIGQQPSGASGPFSLAVTAQVPVRFVGQQYVLTLELWDETTGSPVHIPGGDGGALQPLRAQQVVTVIQPQVPQGFRIPGDCYVGHTFAMQFPTGLPVTAGCTYDFRVEIDGQRMEHLIRFHILGRDPGLVFGGPTGPAAIPGVGPFGP